MPKTINARVYPSTLEKISQANLPEYADSNAARIDYLVAIGLRVVSVENLPGPADADRPLVVTVTEK